MQSKVKQLLLKGNGLVTASDAKNAGINNKVLQRLTKSGDLERINRGLYMDAALMEDVYFLAQFRCSKGLFSHETALYFHDLCDRTPIRLMMTIPNGYNTRLLKNKEEYKFFYCKPELHDMGAVTILSPSSHEIRIYNKERTICDCVKKKDKLDSDLVLEAVKRYMKTKGNNYALLLSYAEKLNVRETIKQYMEMLG